MFVQRAARKAAVFPGVGIAALPGPPKWFLKTHSTTFQLSCVKIKILETQISMQSDIIILFKKSKQPKIASKQSFLNGLSCLN